MNTVTLFARRVVTTFRRTEANKPSSVLNPEVPATTANADGPEGCCSADTPLVSNKNPEAKEQSGEKLLKQDTVKAERQLIIEEVRERLEIFQPDLQLLSRYRKKKNDDIWLLRQELEAKNEVIAASETYTKNLRRQLEDAQKELNELKGQKNQNAEYASCRPEKSPSAQCLTKKQGEKGPSALKNQRGEDCGQHNSQKAAQCCENENKTIVLLREELTAKNEVIATIEEQNQSMKHTLEGYLLKVKEKDDQRQRLEELGKRYLEEIQNLQDTVAKQKAVIGSIEQKIRTKSTQKQSTSAQTEPATIAEAGKVKKENATGSSRVAVRHRTTPLQASATAPLMPAKDQYLFNPQGPMCSQQAISQLKATASGQPSMNTPLHVLPQNRIAGQPRLPLDPVQQRDDPILFLRPHRPRPCLPIDRFVAMISTPLPVASCDAHPPTDPRISNPCQKVKKVGKRSRPNGQQRFIEQEGSCSLSTSTTSFAESSSSSNPKADPVLPRRLTKAFAKWSIQPKNVMLDDRGLPCWAINLNNTPLSPTFRCHDAECKTGIPLRAALTFALKGLDKTHYYTVIDLAKSLTYYQTLTPHDPGKRQLRKNFCRISIEPTKMALKLSLSSFVKQCSHRRSFLQSFFTFPLFEENLSGSPIRTQYAQVVESVRASLVSSHGKIQSTVAIFGSQNARALAAVIEDAAWIPVGRFPETDSSGLQFSSWTKLRHPWELGHCTTKAIFMLEPDVTTEIVDILHGSMESRPGVFSFLILPSNKLRPASPGIDSWFPNWKEQYENKYFKFIGHNDGLNIDQVFEEAEVQDLYINTNGVLTEEGAAAFARAISGCEFASEGRPSGEHYGNNRSGH